MKIALKPVIVCSAVAIWLAVSSATGEGTGERSPAEEAAFQEGLKVGAGRFAWLNASLNDMYRHLWDLERKDELEEHFVENMWLSIVELDRFVENKNADKEDREAAQRVLQRLVVYFAANPKVILRPKGVEFTDAVKEGVQEAVQEDEGSNQVLEALAEATSEPLEEFGGFVDSVRLEAYERDLEILTVLNRHIARRNFPGRGRSVGGVVLILPPDSGGGHGGDDDFHWNGKKVQMELVGGKLEVNGQKYGSVGKGDTVDLRLLGHVFVNDIERQPEIQDAEQAGTGQPATRSLSESDGSAKPQPEAEGRSR